MGRGDEAPPPRPGRTSHDTGRLRDACLRAPRQSSPWGGVAHAGRGTRGRHDVRRPPGPAVSPPAPLALLREGRAIRGFRTRTFGTGRRGDHSPQAVGPWPLLVRSTENIAPSTGCRFDPTRVAAYTHPRTKPARSSRLLDAANARGPCTSVRHYTPPTRFPQDCPRKIIRSRPLCRLWETVSAHVRRGTNHPLTRGSTSVAAMTR